MKKEVRAEFIGEHILIVGKQAYILRIS